MEKEQKLKTTRNECCKHTIGWGNQISFSDTDGHYISYTCRKCGDKVKDYYELANRYNESTEKEEPIPDNE